MATTNFYAPTIAFRVTKSIFDYFFWVPDSWHSVALRHYRIALHIKVVNRQPASTLSQL